ncbi:MAG: hypothetical protein ACSHXI_11965, partial [Hoeflea sp.]|uniref:hypothetical protein n=1 Tax=Hoeflea sp. TaxID=1940281 RepID=UPI003EF47596
TGDTVFNGAVGSAVALVSLTTDAGGTTRINGGSVTAFGTSQTYNDAVVLGADTVLNDGGAVTFNNTVDGAFDLAINTTNQTVFNGAVGGGTVLKSLATDAGGTTEINGGAVTTTGSQSYGDQISTGMMTTLTAISGDINIGAGLTATNPDADFKAIAGRDIVVGGFMSHGTGTGNMILAAGRNFHNDSGSTTPLVTGGRWLIYSTRPDHNRNDIEITNWDFLRYSTVFDSSDPAPASFPSGNGLVYSVTPVVKLSASDETVYYGVSPSPVIIRTVSVNGVLVNAADFALYFDPAIPAFTYGSRVLLTSAGLPFIGSYPDGLVPRGLTTSYHGVVVNADAGDLTVNARPTPLATGNVIYPTGNRVEFDACSPSAGDPGTSADEANAGQICALSPAEQD